ncbi:DegT/DnrJ/EryC1/StrS family aminotransferase [Burkholderia seminalis]|uniref:DegT/DnrJ/EryC1/StrS family aminotransferase n=1 Tax=Burkholderia seminalis TaxID=488731 RepID=UPI00158AC933|nr:DegT/DnrJ/EryC1/StrS family aminotransferase [Burkholderia seminalis]
MAGPGYSFLGEEERNNVNKVLDTWGLTRFAYDVPNFTSFVLQTEEAFASLAEVKHAIAVNSGTSALITSLAALGIGPGDEVIVPGYTFVASIGSIVLSGATPILAEIDDTLTIDPIDVERKITSKTKAIMPVHMLGSPCNMDALCALARRYGLKIVEDVAQACGGSFRGRRLGTHGDLGAFSLNPFKVITSGEGGLVITDDSHLYQRAYAFQDQGWFPLRRDTGNGDILFGLNLRMAELAGAVAVAQIAKLDLVLAATRRAKSVLLRRLELPDDCRIQPRRLNDADGDCATVLVLTCEEREQATRLATTLGSKTLDDSGRHYYQNMSQLRLLGDPDKSSAVFHRHYAGDPTLDAFPSLPQTDDLLRRSVGISIGVSDRYLGAGFGISVQDDDATIDARAHTLREAILAAS